MGAVILIGLLEKTGRNAFAKGIVFGLIFMVTAVSAAGVDSPTHVVKNTIDKVIQLVTDEELKKPDQVSHRRTLLEETIGQHFDFKEMAKRSFAAHWKKRNEEDQQEFVRLFQALLSKTYAKKIENYSGEEIRYLRERLKGPYAEVQTKIISKKTAISLDYRLLLKDDIWRVYDVVVEGVSLVKNYRVQFDRIIHRNSYQKLVETLRDKSGEITSP